MQKWEQKGETERSRDRVAGRGEFRSQRAEGRVQKRVRRGIEGSRDREARGEKREARSERRVTGWGETRPQRRGDTACQSVSICVHLWFHSVRSCLRGEFRFRLGGLGELGGSLHFRLTIGECPNPWCLCVLVVRLRSASCGRPISDRLDLRPIPPMLLTWRDR